MIREITANQSSFQSVAFTKGFNVVLADRKKEETKKHSRNGLGKSTLIEIIHFCLGANADEDVFPKEHLPGWEFSLELAVGSRPVTVTRGVENPANFLVSGVPSNWPIQPTVRKGVEAFTAKEWTLLLGHFLFGLPYDTDGNSLRGPSFRSLISYFIRRRTDAYSIPFESFRKQIASDVQINNAFLLGLAWEDASEFLKIKDRSKDLESIKTAIKAGVLDGFGGKLGDLETRQVRLKDLVTKRQAELESFKVHPHYEQIQTDANRLTGEIHSLVDANLVDRKMLELYGQNVSAEQPPPVDFLDRIYQEVGIFLPTTVFRRIEEVRHFHETIISNRHAFLANEVERIKNALSKREVQSQEKTEERAALMDILKTHGALEEYTKLQQRHLETVSELNAVTLMIKNHRAFESGMSEVRIAQERLHQKARWDLDERRTIRERAISLFNEYSQHLHSAPGNLVVDVGPNGFRFDVEIERSGSGGVGHMKIFCYDLMLARLWAEQSVSPRVLIHDSDIFNGVDERQCARALELAAQESQAHGFQYICTLNSDMIPEKELSSDFDLSQFIRLRLTDDDVKGSLLGVRF
ncbi:MAG: DUF2326 domain-containing protein [Nitrospirae bacterium]|nr:DUF2326 domain-containing protein [Magnetococcales bacterium]HAT49141.1 DUF2326 domain-containing protein [Alphaproteobacteria bacterium]